jgi:pyruvate,water dikinase
MSKPRTSTRLAYAPGEKILPPPEFPVQWTDPAQAGHLWALDRVHFGEPLPPLITAVWQDYIAPAFNQIADNYHLPIRLAFMTCNGYLYSSYPPVSLPPAIILKGLNVLERVWPRLASAIQFSAVSKISRRYLKQVEPIIADLDGHWQHDWRPALQQHLSFWENFDLDTAPRPVLLDHLEESLERIRQVWDIHFQLFVPAYLALHLFEELYREIFIHEDVFAVYRLLGAIDNSFLQAEQALWQLSRQVRTLPVVCQIVADQPVDKIEGALVQLPEGQIFLAKWQAYLRKYGRRGQVTDGLSDISWIEDPTPAWQNLRQMLHQPDRDLNAELQAQIAERDMWISQTRQRLQSHSPATRARFETLLKAAQTAVYLHEEHNFWIDQQAMFQLRQVFLAMGRCLVAESLLETPDDIFFLGPDEVREAAISAPSQKLSDTIRTRRAALAAARQITPPPALGTMSLLTPMADPLYSAFTKVLGSLAPAVPTSQTAPEILYGQAASPGTARGPARIIHDLAASGRLQPGDILIARTTLPPWTPLFAVAAAVVTETGGILSHAAIISREAGIPAVVGVTGAVNAVQDGQFVEVDGHKGVVQLHPITHTIVAAVGVS